MPHVLVPYGELCGFYKGWRGQQRTFQNF